MNYFDFNKSLHSCNFLLKCYKNLRRSLDLLKHHLISLHPDIIIIILFFIYSFMYLLGGEG